MKRPPLSFWKAAASSERQRRGLHCFICGTAPFAPIYSARRVAVPSAGTAIKDKGSGRKAPRSVRLFLPRHTTLYRDRNFGDGKRRQQTVRHRITSFQYVEPRTLSVNPQRSHVKEMYATIWCTPHPVCCFLCIARFSESAGCASPPGGEVPATQNATLAYA